MLVCIQVAPMQETKTEKLISAIVDREIRGACFHLERLRLKKIRGEMRRVKDRLLPGYIFVDTSDFDELYTQLKRVPKLTSVVLAKAAWQPDIYGWTDFFQLSEEEERVIRSLVADGSGNTLKAAGSSSGLNVMEEPNTLTLTTCANTNPRIAPSTPPSVPRKMPSQLSSIGSLPLWSKAMMSMLPSLLMSQGTKEGESATRKGGAVETFVHLCVRGAKSARYDTGLLVVSPVAES